MIYAFECTVKDAPWGWAPTVINSTTASKAKVEYWRDVTDSWPDVPFIDVRVRKVGGPHTSEQFVRNAHYRGMPEVKCGQRVRVKSSAGDSLGYIVGHNSSANFNVLFDEGRLAGGTYNVHPSEIILADSIGAHERKAP